MLNAINSANRDNHPMLPPIHVSNTGETVKRRFGDFA
jgi:hypothetical protein